MMTKRKSKAAGERRQRKFTPWESDRVTPSSPSSLDVLMQWLTAPGNALRWRQARARKVLCQEVLTALERHGISHREMGDVDIKVRVLEKQFLKASAFLGGKKAGEAFERGDTDAVKHVLRLCPQYRELLTVFGRFSTGREVQLAAAAAVAAAQNNGVTSSPTDAGRKSAAGKWKESLEKNRPRTASEEKNAERAASGLVKQNNALNGEIKMSKEKGGTGAVPGVATVVTCGKKGVDGGKKKDVVEDGKSSGQKNYITGKDDIVEEEDGTLADVESEDEPKTQVHVESEGESSEEEEQAQREAAVATKRKYALKTKQHEAGESSSEEESSDGETQDSQEEEMGDIDVEEQIPLAQPDEEQAEEAKANSEAKADKDSESDNNEEEDDEDDEEEEEAEEHQEANAAKANTSSNASDSSSSESESEGTNDEAEAGSTPKVTKSSDHDDSENDGNDDDDMAEGDQNHSDSDAEPPLHSRKRNMKEIPGPHGKRARKVTHELELEAYIQRAKQEQAQRQELFQLERAKLECELEAKRVHLAMEKTLARKKLLGAGVELAEVDRVLPP